MSKLPVLSGRDVLKALTRAGFEIVGRKGSHIRLKKRVGSEVFIVIVPAHAELATGTLLSIIKQSGITREDFVKFLK